MQIGIKKRQFNKKLQDIMKSKGITNNDLTECVGRKSVSWASHVINFKAMPNEHEMMAISILLETPEDVLFPPEYKEIYDHLKGVVNDVDLCVTSRMLYSEPSRLVSDNNLEIHKSDEQTIDLCLGVLNERERDVVCIRHGLKGEPTHTLEEAGKRFGVTRERIRQMEAKALEKIRQSKCASELSNISI